MITLEYIPLWAVPAVQHDVNTGRTHGNALTHDMAVGRVWHAVISSEPCDEKSYSELGTP